ncbi:unnamed protein product [Didymodactylos carnosus]|uniref:Uncharacterized protein n=1 Tax=Didymodactylos carnosus TaxID=1234261 RepID=A0A8S2TQ23_9BILA|nr:unnamed protein product [Didymodactylos carnosus]
MNYSELLKIITSFLIQWLQKQQKKKNRQLKPVRLAQLCDPNRENLVLLNGERGLEAINVECDAQQRQIHNHHHHRHRPYHNRNANSFINSKQAQLFQQTLYTLLQLSIMADNNERLTQSGCCVNTPNIFTPPEPSTKKKPSTSSS